MAEEKEKSWLERSAAAILITLATAGILTGIGLLMSMNIKLAVMETKFSTIETGSTQTAGEIKELKSDLSKLQEDVSALKASDQDRKDARSKGR